MHSKSCVPWWGIYFAPGFVLLPFLFLHLQNCKKQFCPLLSAHESAFGGVLQARVLFHPVLAAVWHWIVSCMFLCPKRKSTVCDCPILKCSLHFKRRHTYSKEKCFKIPHYHSQHLGAVSMGTGWPQPDWALWKFPLGLQECSSLPQSSSQLPSLEAKIRICGQNIYWCNGCVLQGLCWGLSFNIVLKVLKVQRPIKNCILTVWKT